MSFFCLNFFRGFPHHGPHIPAGSASGLLSSLSSIPLPSSSWHLSHFAFFAPLILWPIQALPYLRAFVQAVPSGWKPLPTVFTWLNQGSSLRSVLKCHILRGSLQTEAVLLPHFSSLFIFFQDLSQSINTNARVC